MGKMNPIIKEQWAADLESGDYAKCTGALCRPGKGHDSFCCLGLLCNIFAEQQGGEEGFDEKIGKDGSSLRAPCLTFDGEKGILPRRVREWAGLESANPAIMHEGQKRCLATLNDGTFGAEKLNFKEIAVKIREQL